MEEREGNGGKSGEETREEMDVKKKEGMRG